MFKNISQYIFSLIIIGLLSACGQTDSGNGEAFIISNPVVQSAPDAPSNINLWDFSTDSDCIVRIRWKDESDNEDRFTIEQLAYPSFSSSPVVSTLIYESNEAIGEVESMGFRFLFDALPNPTVYVEYRVRSENRFGVSDWSPYFGIETPLCI